MNWETTLSGLWTFANSGVGIMLLGSVLVGVLGWIFARKPAWKAWEGTIISAVQAAEKAIPNDTPNSGLQKLDYALQLVLLAYASGKAKMANASTEASLKEGVQIVHANLEAAGNLDGKATPPAADGVAGGTSIAMLLLCLGLAGLLCGSGCMWKASDSVVGAQRTLSVEKTDANTMAVKMIENGQSINATKVRLSNTPKGGQTLTIGTLSETDTVAEPQGQVAAIQQQVYGQGFRDALQAIVALKNGTDFNPTSTAKTDYVPTVRAAISGDDTAAMLANCENEAEQRIVLKAKGLLPKAQAKPATPKKKAPPATQPSAELEPTTRPIPLESLIAPSGS